MFEKNLNDRLGKKPGSPGYVRVIFIPMTRDRILPALKEGYGDLAAANLVFTESRKEEFLFSAPALSNWREVGREPVQYVGNIYKYYISFRSLRRYGLQTGRSIE